MIVIPYFYCATKLGLFLEKGGTALWTIADDDDVKQTLQDNGFPVISLTVSTCKSVTYAEIKYDDMSLNDFYLSTDPNVSEKDVWRIFDIPDVVRTMPEFRRAFYILTNKYV